MHNVHAHVCSRACQTCGHTDQDVVWFDVAVQYRGLLEEFERQQQLLRVRTHRLDVQAHVLAVLLENLAQVHADNR